MLKKISNDLDCSEDDALFSASEFDDRFSGNYCHNKNISSVKNLFICRKQKYKESI